MPTKRELFIERQRAASKADRESKPWLEKPKPTRKKAKSKSCYNEIEAEYMPDSFDPPDEPTW